MLRYIVVGFLYGVSLAAIAVVAAGAGHGTYIPLTLASAPFCLLGVLIALIGTPLLWGLVGYLCWRVAKGKSIVPLVALMGSHYIVGLFLAFNPNSQYHDMDRLLDGIKFGMQPLFVVGAAVYVLGQLCLWAYFFYAKRAISRA